MKKKIIAMTLTAAALASLCACGPDIPDMTGKAAAESKTTESSSSQASETEKKEVTLDLTVTDKVINMPAVDNFRIEASYNGGGKTNIDPISIKGIELDTKAVTSAFFGDQKYSDNSYDNMNSFMSGDAVIEFSKPTSTFGTLFNYHKDKGLAINDLFVNALYDLNEDSLSFMSPDEASALISDKLKQINVEVPESYRIHSLTYQDLQKIYDKVKELNNKSYSTVFFENYNFSPADDIYIISWTGSLNGLKNSMGRRYAIVSNAGIEFLNMEFLVEADEKITADSTEILPVDKAVKAVFDVYKTEDSKQEAVINDISLEYMADMHNNFYPSWILKGKAGDETLVYGVDAYSGDVSKFDTTSPAGDNILGLI